jgi:uncharacterized protein (TIGR00730 family)
MKRVCVFCGSSLGNRAAYKEAARKTGMALVERGIGLVYGGAHVGLMGLLADTVLDAGGEVYGVMPRSMVQREIAHTRLTNLDIVDTMHQRKARMADLSDGFVVLPGAYGTLDETFEILTWAQLRIHSKPCGFLNIDGFYDALFAFLDRSMEDGFLKASNRQLILVESDPQRLLDRMPAHMEEQSSRMEAKW